MRIKTSNSITLQNLTICYILLYSIMPIVSRLTSRFLTTYFYMALTVFLVAYIVFLDRPSNVNIYLTFLLPFIIYAALTYFMPHDGLIMWGYQKLLFLLPAVLGYFFIQDKSRIQSYFPKVLLMAVFVTMVTTIIGCIRNPYAARILATVDSSDSLSYKYDMQNIGGYSFVYYMILLYPLLILAYKTKRIKLLPTIVLTMTILVTVIYSEYTTALLMFLITSMLFITKKELPIRNIVFASLVAVAFLFLFSDAVSTFLRWVGSVSGSHAISERLNALAGGTAGLEASEDDRIKLYRKSLELFFSNPLVGTMLQSYKTNGGHSFILDSLASYGLLAGAALYSIYKRIFTQFYLPFKEKPGYNYIVWTFIQAIILSTVNTGIFLEVLCLFVPLTLYWIYEMKPKTEEKKTVKSLR